jgi:hypothetical protein
VVQAYVAFWPSFEFPASLCCTQTTRMPACLKVPAHVQYILHVSLSLVSIYEVTEERGTSFIYEFAVRNKK